MLCSSNQNFKERVTTLKENILYLYISQEKVDIPKLQSYIDVGSVNQIEEVNLLRAILKL